MISVTDLRAGTVFPSFASQLAKAMRDKKASEDEEDL